MGKDFTKGLGPCAGDVFYLELRQYELTVEITKVLPPLVISHAFSEKCYPLVFIEV